MFARKALGRHSAARQSADVLLRALAERSHGLGNHTRRVGDLADRVARRLGLEDTERAPIVRAALLHDVGKLAVPDAILDKPSGLDPAEWDVIRRHTLVGERILRGAPSLEPVAPLVRSSHERWDGGGYPDGLAGEEIPLGSRIIFACDAFEAMTSTGRPYRTPATVEDALAELGRGAGHQFDPRVVAALDAIVREDLATVAPGAGMTAVAGGGPIPRDLTRSGAGAGAPRPGRSGGRRGGP
jgi:two-component system cell cycle response regulator